MLTDVLALFEVELLIPFLSLVEVILVAVTSWNLTGVQNYPAQTDVYDGQQFDFIVVGAGSAGCVLANRLTEIGNWSVLLIEAGDQPPGVANSPGLSAIGTSSLPDWGYHTVNDNFSSQALINKSIHMIRGKMIGGSSASNLMFYVRGNKADYENWVSQGNVGWDWENVTNYFKKSERLNDPGILSSDTAALHNDEGNLGVSKSLVDESLTTMYFKAFNENGYEYLEDTNGYQQIGFSNPQFTIDDKLRQSTGLTFIVPFADRENLHLLTGTNARKVNFEGNRAVGVEIKLPSGNIINVTAANEVILSAGAINSPQLLMLSGVGPVDHLKDLNIDVNIDSPNVGQNMQDHMQLPILLTAQKNLLSIIENLDVLNNLDKFPIPTMMGFAALDKNQTYPDYQVIAVPSPMASLAPTLQCSELMALEDRICIAMAEYSLKKETLFTFLVFLHPESRGNVTLRSSDPEEKPAIYSGYFSNLDDIEKYALYVEDYISVVNTSELKKVNAAVADVDVEQCESLTFGSHEYWKCYVQNLAGTLYHPSGTCAMGPEGSGVVDERLRVWGADGLRVVDAGVIPSMPSGNINAPVIMIAEKAADMIKVDYGL